MAVRCGSERTGEVRLCPEESLCLRRCPRCVPVCPDDSMVFPGVPVTFGVSSGGTPMVESFSEVTPVCC